MIKYTNNTWKRLQELYKESGYKVRFGKGNFNTGYCLLTDPNNDQKKIIVVNRYHSLESKINSLIEILDKVDINVEALSESNQKWLVKIKAEKQLEDE